MASVDARDVQANLAAFASAKLPGITAQALTKAAWAAKDALQASMQSVFDRPTPFTMRSPIVIPAERGLNNPFAVVGFREWAPKGVPAGRYLQPQVFGGQRPQKGMERALGLRPTRQATPGKWAELDAYGNMNPGQLRKIMSFLRLGGSTTSAAQNRGNRPSKGKRRAEEYFIVPVGRTDSLLPPGIYRRGSEFGGAPLLVVAFVRAAEYEPRFPFSQVVKKAVDQSLHRAFLEAFGEKMAASLARR